MRRNIPEQAMLSLAFLGAGAGNLLFHLAAVRSVTPDVYAGFGVLTALMAIATIPLGAVEIAFAAAIARSSATGRVGADATVAAFRRLVALPACVGAVAISVGAVAILHIPLRQGVLLLLLLLAAAGMTLGRSLLIGGRHFRAAGVAVLAPAAGRLAALLLLFQVGAGVGAGALIAVTVAGESVAAALSLVLAQRRFEPDGAAPDVDGGDLGVATGAFGAVAILAGADVIMARLGLSPLQVGRVAAAANIARAGLYLPQAVAVASLPDLSVGPARRASVLLNRAVVLLTILSLAGILVVSLVAERLGGLLLGDVAAGRLLPGLTLAALGVGLTHLMVTALLARRSRLALYPWVLVPLVALGAVLQTVTSTVAATVAITLVAAVAGRALFAVHRRGADGSADDALPSPAEALLGTTVSVVVPAYRPGPGFEAHLHDLRRLLDGVALRGWELIVVDDGCPDQAGDRAAALGFDGLEVVRSVGNHGKGHALRAGIARTTGEVVVFIDADGDIPASDAVATVAQLAATTSDVVIADKTHPRSTSGRTLPRRAMTFGWGTFVQLLFGLEVADTQVGCKALRGDLARGLASRCREDGFAFDLELLVLAKRAGAVIASAPVHIIDVADSTVRPAAILGMCRSAVQLRRASADPMPLPAPDVIDVAVAA